MRRLQPQPGPWVGQIRGRGMPRRTSPWLIVGQLYLSSLLLASARVPITESDQVQLSSRYPHSAHQSLYTRAASLAIYSPYQVPSYVYTLS